jgi:hypothetical protein
MNARIGVFLVAIVAVLGDPYLAVVFIAAAVALLVLLVAWAGDEAGEAAAKRTRVSDSEPA